MRELNQLLLLKHPNLIGLQDFYITDNKCHIITDLSEGGDLRSALDLRGSFPEEDAREILTRLLEGLEYMHKNNVAHRDLKLDNVLIVDNKGPTNVQIADLGMAKFLSAESLHTVCGTPQFMAPEVLLPAETPDKDRYGRVCWP